ncbi:MAG: indolepyruvate ferredoxin oxidoreductase subunit alpha [Victivallales bacterium]|nr:indolepyruvate ferredoxin oxidoreductase subunit alpha [Victivallales bacterium]
MHKEFIMGNAAIAMGALASGVNLVAGYPGTPSSEVLETVATKRKAGTYVEWSVNEKSAMEVAAGAAYAGARVMVTMKQVGLNVASDPLMSLEYVGVKGGMVVLVADDPGPISSQTEQDTRTFAMFSKLPCFDPSSVAEAYQMVQDAFVLSEKYGTPVFLRPTTRVCHAYASIDLKDESEYQVHQPEGFVKDSKRWVIFPRLSFANHAKIELRNDELRTEFASYEGNRITLGANGIRKGVVAGGISYAYVQDAIEKLPAEVRPRLLKIGTPFPFPEPLALEFLEGLDEIMCFEELDPVLERTMNYVIGHNLLKIKVLGKISGSLPRSGENTIDGVLKSLREFTEGSVPMHSCVGRKTAQCAGTELPPPQLPVRPPVLCAGCPHRASFYAVKRAMAGKKTIFCGDIGCYTLGNAQPLDMCDTCLCMGAGLGIAQGVGHIEPDTECFAFVGDSTFFASAITGVVNAVYNQARMTLVVLDNSTTAMTGHQPHPGTGKTMMGEAVAKISIEQVLRGIGLAVVETVDPLEHAKAVETVKRVAAEPGVKAIIFKSPCIAIVPPHEKHTVDSGKCVKCKRCIKELGCPALYLSGGEVRIDPSLCTGCTLCAQICPTHAIGACHE